MNMKQSVNLLSVLPRAWGAAPPKRGRNNDEQLAALEVGSINVVYVAAGSAAKFAHVPGLKGKVLIALDTGGFAALVELLMVYHMDNICSYEAVVLPDDEMSD